MRVTIEVSTEVEIVGTIVNDVSISSEVRVPMAVWSVVIVSVLVCVEVVDTTLVENSTSVDI